MPRQLSMDKVQQIIGEDATKKLLSEAPGMIIYVTDSDRRSREERDEAIRDTFYNNPLLKHEEIGKQFGLSGERIRQMVNSKKHPV